MNHDNDNGFRFLSVCSGIEAASVAWPTWQAVAFSEIEKFPSAVLAHHYPTVPNLGDFTAIDPTRLGRVDIFCGGTPCQAFSVAGLRQSLADERGNLSLEFVRLAHELAGLGKTDGNGLRNVVWENVVGVLSTKDNAFGCFLAGLVGAVAPIEPIGRWTDAGMVSGPKGRAAWRVFDAQYFGLAQRRKRVIVVADFGNGADPAAVLLVEQGVRRNSPPSREAGKGTSHPDAPSLTASGRGVERTGDIRGQDPVVAILRGHSDYGDGLPSIRAKGGDCAGGSEALVFAPEIARCVATLEDSSQDYESTTMVAHAIQAGALRTNPNSGPDGVGVQEGLAYTLEARAEVQAVSVTVYIAHTLKAEGADASEDGTGRGTPIIAFGWQNSSSQGLSDSEHISPTLDKSKTPAVTVALRGREGGATAELGGEVATALRASSGGGDKPHVLTSAVRRLIPRECERLMGFPDDYTAIPYGHVSEKKLDDDYVKYMARGNPKGLTRAEVARLASDGPRYKALGNSWAVPLFTWLGRRIEQHMPVAAFLSQGITDPRLINSLCNLRPLWALDNMSKGAAWPLTANNDNGRDTDAAAG